MFYLCRNFNNCTMGFKMYPRPGKPTESSLKDWVERCNFVFQVEAKVQSLNIQEGSVDDKSGWLLSVFKRDLKTTSNDDVIETKKKTTIYLRNENATSNSTLRKVFLKSIPGSICRMNSEDFWGIVQEDIKSIQNVYVSSYCGKTKVNTDIYWVFPEIILSEKGVCVQTNKIFVHRESLSRRENGDKISLPKQFPYPHSNSTKYYQKLGKHLQAYYGPRTPHAIHILSSALKALNRDILIESEHQVSIMNVSGPPNIGKTFACAIALQLLNSKELMISKCTASAILDLTDMFHNMLIVWDDPRDTSSSQLCSIVHEAFHGHTSSTVSKGNRSYNSNIIIGTQQKLLGVPIVYENTPTFSRLSHVDMDIHTTFTPSREDEQKLQKAVACIQNCFELLLSVQYDKNKVDKLHNHLLKCDTKNEIIPRSLRNLAVDWYFCKEMINLGLDSNEVSQNMHNMIDTYFRKTQIQLLKEHCSNIEPFEKFCILLSSLMEYHIPTSFFKAKVMVHFADYGMKECIALYLKEFFPFMHETLPESKIFTPEMVQNEVKKSNGKLGVICKNVNFKYEHGGSVIRRAIVIRADVVKKHKIGAKPPDLV